MKDVGCGEVTAWGGLSANLKSEANAQIHRSGGGQDPCGGGFFDAVPAQEERMVRLIENFVLLKNNEGRGE